MPTYNVVRNGEIITTITASSLTQAKKDVYEQFDDSDDVEVVGVWNEPEE